MKEKRGFVRINVDAHMTYAIKESAHPPQRVTLEDISSEGVRVIINKPLQSSDVLELTLQIPGIAKDIKAQAQVVWQREITFNLFDTGIRFTGMKDEDNKTLVDFIERITGRNTERREYVRCDLNTEIKYSLIGDPDMKNDCSSVDVCVLGLKILAREKLEKGTQLRIVFNLPQEKDEIVAKCTVVAWVKKGEKDLFETGIEFLEISEEDKGRISRFIQKKLEQQV